MSPIKQVIEKLLPPILTAACAMTTLSLHAIADDFRTVAIRNGVPPGTPNGTAFASFYRPKINRLGDVYFEGSWTGQNYGIWSEVTGMLNMVAADGTAAPQTESGTVYDFNALATLDQRFMVANNGDAAFTAGLTGTAISNSNDTGIWSWRNSSLELVARKGNIAPDAGAGTTFSGLNQFVLSNLGQIAFIANVSGDDVTVSNNTGIWSEGGTGVLHLVARSGDVATVTAANFDQFLPHRVAINTAGQTLFAATLAGSGVTTSNNEGIWISTSGITRLVVREGSTAPGTTQVFRFTSFDGAFGPPVLSSCGEVAFIGQLAGGPISNGIWSELGGLLHLITSEESPAPGAGPNVEFASFNSLTMNSPGNLAFQATLVGDGVTGNNNRGIWTTHGETIHMVARTGNPAPGTEDGVNFTNSTLEMTLNSRGQLAFRGDLTGPGIHSGNDSGYWATDINGDLQLVVREGEVIDIDNGPGIDLQTIASLQIVNSSVYSFSGNNDGRASAFNDLGSFTFAATFTDGLAGVFVSNRVYNPLLFLDGDFNEDGNVDDDDLTIWKAHFGEQSQVEHMNGDADFDCDVDGNDFLIWQREFGTTPSLASVPESSASIYAAISLSFLSMASRHRK